MNQKNLLISVLLSLTLIGVQAIYVAEANFLFPPNSIPFIHIRSDGSIDPSTAPISRNGNVYTLTSNITGYTLGIERDNTVIDGAGYTISSDNKSSPAISIGLRSNVTIKNVCVAWFCSAHIAMGGATNCTITNNTITTIAGGAMALNGCNNCTITNNTIYNADLLYDDGRGESVYFSGFGNVISGNTFLGGEVGMGFYGTNNTITNNTFTGTKKYISFSRTSYPNIVENNTVNGITISEQLNSTPSPSPIVTRTPTNNPTSTASHSPASSPTPTPEPSPSTSNQSASHAPTNSQQPTEEAPEVVSLPTEIIGLIVVASSICIIVLTFLIWKRQTRM